MLDAECDLGLPFFSSRSFLSYSSLGNPPRSRPPCRPIFASLKSHRRPGARRARADRGGADGWAAARGTDPYARWCGRGGTARCPPIPIKHLRWSRPICANPALAARGHEARDRNRAAQAAPDLARREASLYQFAFIIVNQRIIILTKAGRPKVAAPARPRSPPRGCDAIRVSRFQARSVGSTS